MKFFIHILMNDTLETTPQNWVWIARTSNFEDESKWEKCIL